MITGAPVSNAVLHGFGESSTRIGRLWSVISHAAPNQHQTFYPGNSFDKKCIKTHKPLFKDNELGYNLVFYFKWKFITFH